MVFVEINTFIQFILRFYSLWEMFFTFILFTQTLLSSYIILRPLSTMLRQNRWLFFTLHNDTWSFKSLSNNGDASYMHIAGELRASTGLILRTPCIGRQSSGKLGPRIVEDCRIPGFVIKLISFMLYPSHGSHSRNNSWELALLANRGWSTRCIFLWNAVACLVKCWRQQNLRSCLQVKGIGFVSSERHCDNSMLC